MSESHTEYSQDDPIGISYEVVTINLNDKSIVRNVAIATVTVVLVKGAMNVLGRQAKTSIGRLARKFKMRAIDEAHRMAEVKERKAEEEIAGESS